MCWTATLNSERSHLKSVDIKALIRATGQHSDRLEAHLELLRTQDPPAFGVARVIVHDVDTVEGARDAAV